MKAIPRIHILNANSAIIFDQLVSEFKVEISPLILYLLMSFGNEDSSFYPAFRTFYSMTQSLLPHGKHTLRLLEKAGVPNLHAIGSRQKGLTANINAHNLIRRRKWFKRNITARKGNIPPAREGSANSDSFNIPLNWARKPEFEPANISDRQILAIKFPSCLLESETIISIPTLKSRETCLAIAVVDTPEESSIGSIQTFKHVLKHLGAYLRVFRESYFEFRKLLDLVIARDIPLVLTIDDDTLFKSSIVEMTTKIQPITGLLKGLVARQKTILKAFFPLHNSNIAHCRKGSKRVFSPAML